MALWLIIALLVSGVLAWASERAGPGWPRWISLLALTGTATWLAAVWAAGITPGVVEWPWIPRFGINVILAMDGLSLLLVLLTLVLGAVAVATSWAEIDRRPGLFQLNVLLTLAGVVGVFTTLDLFLLFVFWEVMVVPMYLLVALWGHEERARAAMKFLLFTQISGLFMLASIIAVALHHLAATGELTFDYRVLVHGPVAGLPLWVMAGFLVAFLTKLPIVPLHSWSPDAYTQAPTAGSVILAGVMVNTGAYGLIRFVVPLFPGGAAELQVPIMLLGAGSVVYGAYLAFAQDDIKRLVAYSSIGHMGLVLLGVFAWNPIALQGAVVQIVAHSFSTAGLFIVAGALQERLHTRALSRMGGLWDAAPRMGALTLVFVLAALGMPGLGNFVGEFMVLLGAFPVNTASTVLAASGLVFTVAYALLLMQRSFQGRVATAGLALRDFHVRELGMALVVVVALVGLGLYPQPVLHLSAPVTGALQALTEAWP